jgi:hypothetical protein
VSPVLVPMWQGCAQSWCRCGRGEPSPGADVVGVSPVLVPMCHASPCGALAPLPAGRHRSREKESALPHKGAACVHCVHCMRALHACVCVRALPRLSSPSWARSTRVWPSSARAAARPSAHRSAKRPTLRPPPQSAAAAALRERALPKGAVLTRCDLLAEGHCDAAAAVKRAERVPVCAYVQPSRQAHVVTLAPAHPLMQATPSGRD